MDKTVKVGQYRLGASEPCFLIAEIGINHNGSLETAKKLIDAAVANGFQAVKFQKRTVEIVYSKEELARERESVFGKTNGDLKRGLEFGFAEYKEIDNYCRSKGILWFVSPWDEPSVDFCEQFDLPCYKVASASITDHALLQKIKQTQKPILLSTGMSTLAEIDAAMAILQGCEVVIMHTTSTYPCAHEEINLAVINTLRQRYQVPVGYSGHEPDVMPSVFAVASYQACAVERHVTLDRAMWGSDQAASLEPRGMQLLSKYIRLHAVVRGDGVKRVYASEVPVRDKLRRVDMTKQLETI